MVSAAPISHIAPAPVHADKTRTMANRPAMNFRARIIGIRLALSFAEHKWRGYPSDLKSSSVQIVDGDCLHPSRKPMRDRNICRPSCRYFNLSVASIAVANHSHSY